MRLIVLSQETSAKAMSTSGQTAVLGNFARIEVRNRRATLQLSGDSQATELDTRHVAQLARRALPLHPWAVPVSDDAMGLDGADTGTGIPTIPGIPPHTEAEYQEEPDVPDKRAAIIRKAAAAGLSRKDIATLLGGNYTKAHGVVKSVLDAD